MITDENGRKSLVFGHVTLYSLVPIFSKSQLSNIINCTKAHDRHRYNICIVKVIIFSFLRFLSVSRMKSNSNALKCNSLSEVMLLVDIPKLIVNHLYCCYRVSNQPSPSRNEYIYELSKYKLMSSKANLQHPCVFRLFLLLSSPSGEGEADVYSRYRACDRRSPLLNDAVSLFDSFFCFLSLSSLCS